MRVVQSWDIAAKTGPNNDWSVCTTWIIDDGAYYLLDLTRGRYEFPELRRITIELAQRFKPHRILIEDASAGTALIQELTKMRKFAIRAVPVERDKVTRLYVQQAKFESGQVLFPRKAAFLPALETELLTFPQSKTDDQVDSISQALNHQFSGYDSTLSWVRTPRDPHLS